MSNQNPLDFLSDEDVILPTGGTGGGNKGFVSPWIAAVTYVVMTQKGPEDLGIKPVSDKVLGESGWHRYYYTDYESGKKASENVGAGNAQQTWVFETETKRIINAADLDKVLEGFGPRVSYECGVTSLMSKTHRHEMHMITLPSVVAAVATMLGFDNPGYDLSELLVRDDEFVATDELQTQLVGAVDAKPDDEGYYTKSILWKRREALWAALGEPNAMAYEPIGKTDKNGKPSKFATTSEMLSECLKVLNKTWKKPVWCQIGTALDPRVGAQSKKSGKQSTLPVMFAIFSDEHSAKAHVESLKKDSGEEPSGSNGTTPATNKPAYPAAWMEIKEEWEAALHDAFAEGKTNSEVVKEVGDCSVKDVSAWRKFLNA